MRTLLLPFSLFALFVFSPVMAHAKKMATPTDHGDYVSARLLLPRYDIRQQDTIEGAIEIQLQPGWHTYWRNAGDVGLPIDFTWESNSSNIENIDILWPTPKRFEISGIQNFGYEDKVIFPITVKLSDIQQNASISFSLNIMVCKQICIPQMLSLKSSLTTNGDLSDTGHQALIEASRKHVPHIGDNEHLSLGTAVAGPDALVFTAFSDKGFTHADLFLEHDALFLTGKPVFEPNASDGNKALIKIEIPEDIDDFSAELKGTTLRATFVVRGEAIEKEFKF